MLLHGSLSRSAQERPGHPALVADGQAHSFAELDRDSDRLAGYLQRAGIGRGDRTAVVMDNTANMVVGFWGALKAGATVVPVNHTANSNRMAFILADCAARCLIAPARLHPRLAGPLAEAPTAIHTVWGDSPRFGDILSRTDSPARDPGLIDQDLCAILYTSGSTGRPKGVMLSHRSLVTSVRAIAAYLRTGPDDVILCVLPLSSNYGLTQILTAAEAACTVVLKRAFAYPYEILSSVAEHRITVFPCVPTVFATLLQFAPFDGIDLASLATLTTSSAPCPPSHLLRLAELFPRTAIFSMYGMTECTRTSYLDPKLVTVKPDSVGRAVPNVEVAVMGEDHRRCAAGEVGELLVRGTCVMRGYWHRPAETARALADGDTPGETWLHTGDLFRMDEDGDLYFVGRTDDMFKCRGDKVIPREIENVIHESDEVAEAAVVGVPHPLDGMAVIAHVVPAPGREPTERSLRRHCMARLDPNLVPRTFIIRASLPKTESGKISKSALTAPNGPPA